MIALNGKAALATSPADQVADSPPQFCHYIEMWKACSHFLQEQLTQQKQKHIQQLVGFKQKHDLVSEGFEVGLQNKDMKSTNSKPITHS